MLIGNRVQAQDKHVSDPGNQHNYGPHQDQISDQSTGNVKYTLLECPITTELVQENGYDFNAGNNVKDFLYDIDVINPIVKLIVQSPVGKLV